MCVWVWGGGGWWWGGVILLCEQRRGGAEAVVIHDLVLPCLPQGHSLGTEMLTPRRGLEMEREAFHCDTPEAP